MISSRCWHKREKVEVTQISEEVLSRRRGNQYCISELVTRSTVTAKKKQCITPMSYAARCVRTVRCSVFDKSLWRLQQ